MTSLIHLIRRYIDDFDSYFPIFHMPGFQNKHFLGLIAIICVEYASKPPPIRPPTRGMAFPKLMALFVPKRDNKRMVTVRLMRLKSTADNR